MNVLFVCTGNVARSPMAARLFRELSRAPGRFVARSAGTDPRAPRPLTTRELAWADVVAVMEAEHLATIRQHWPDQVGKVRVLGVPDDYDPEEPALRRVLLPRVQALLGELERAAPRVRPG